MYLLFDDKMKETDFSEDFDNQLTEVKNKIDEKINNLKDNLNLNSRKYYYEFELSKYEESKVRELDTKQGIYIFYIDRVHFSKFKDKWDSADIKRYSPKILKGRIEDYKKEKEKKWIPLYIGKSKKVISRITQHITLKKESTTSSMKLQERKEFKNNMFAVRIIPLKTQHYDIIAHYIESELRKTINPIVGKK